jgi:hypothetical protein
MLMPETPPALVRPSLEQQLVAQVAKANRKNAGLAAINADLSRRLRRASDVVASVLRDHAKYHLQAVDVADRVRRALAPEPIRRVNVYRSPPAPPADPTKGDPLPGPPPS